MRRSNNLFTGTIPETLTRMPSLTDLQLQVNKFTGAVPAFGSGTPRLTFLDISSNFLAGASKEK